MSTSEKNPFEPTKKIGEEDEVVQLEDVTYGKSSGLSLSSQSLNAIYNAAVAKAKPQVQQQRPKS